jgi:hypothetical protein
VPQPLRKNPLGYFNTAVRSHNHANEQFEFLRKAERYGDGTIATDVVIRAFMAIQLAHQKTLDNLIEVVRPLVEGESNEDAPSSKNEYE